MGVGWLGYNIRKAHRKLKYYFSSRFKILGPDLALNYVIFYVESVALLIIYIVTNIMKFLFILLAQYR